MKYSYKVEGLHCPNCAARLEKGVAKLEGVESASVNFTTQKLSIETSEDKIDAILEQAQAAAKKMDPDWVIVK